MGLAPSTLLRCAQLLALREIWSAYRTGKLNKARFAALSALVVAFALGDSPRFPLWARVLGVGKHVVPRKVGGEVAPGFEAVREAFQRNVDEGLERGAQFVAYYKGKKVVDLYGGTLPDYDGDTQQIIFSNSKSLSAIVLALAVAAGRVEYGAKVSDYWPEFAQNGKEDITVADVMRHDSGLAYFDGEDKADLFSATRERLDELADFVAQQPPTWVKTGDEPKTRIYHALTREFIVGEIVRRTDPEKRSLGTIMRAEIAEPLGATLTLGPGTDDEKSRVSPLKFDTFPEILLRFYLKKLTEGTSKDENERFAAFGNPASPLARSFACIEVSATENPAEWFNDTNGHAAEVGSATVRSNARSLGKVADAMARRALLPVDVHEAAVGEPVTKFDYGLLKDIAFTQGGFCKFGYPTWDHSTEGFVGWGGFGGSQMIWNETLQLGVAYTMNGNLFGSLIGVCDPRFLRLHKTLLACLEQAQAPM